MCAGEVSRRGRVPTVRAVVGKGHAASAKEHAQITCGFLFGVFELTASCLCSPYPDFGDDVLAALAQLQIVCLL